MSRRPERHPTDPTELDELLETVPLRFVYVRDAAPELGLAVSSYRATAPVGAVVSALARELDTLTDTLNTERARLRTAHAALAAAQTAATGLLDTLDTLDALGRSDNG
jgi:hypothetical protein